MSIAAIFLTGLGAIGAAFVVGLAIFGIAIKGFDRFATGDEGLGYVWLAGVFGIIAAVLAAGAVIVGAL